MKISLKKYKWYSIRWRVIALLIAIVLLFVCYLGYRVYLIKRTLPIGSGSAGPAVSVEPFQKVWSHEKFVLVGIGDSVTRGFGAPLPHTYFALLQNNDDIQYPDMAGRDLKHVLPNLEAFNYSENYTVTQQHISRQLPKIRTWPSDVRGIVVITSGGNDLIHNYGLSVPKDEAMYGCTYQQGLIWTENLKLRIKMILEGVTAKFPGGCEIFFANIYDPTDGVGDPQTIGLPAWPDAVKILELTNHKIAELCNSYQNVHLVDIRSEFLGHGIHCTEIWRKYYHKDDPHYWYALNLEDPNPRGYDAVRRLFLLEIAKVLPKKLAETNQEQLKH